MNPNEGTELRRAEPSNLNLPAVEEDIRQGLVGQAKTFVNEISGLSSQNPAFESMLKRIENLGHGELSSVGGGSRRMMERSLQNGHGGNSHEIVSSALGNLNVLVKELVPSPANISPRGIFGIPKKNGLNLYFDKYADANDTINAVVKSLLAGKSAIIKDNAMLEQEKQELIGTLGTLNEYLVLVDILEQETLVKIEELKANGVQSANELRMFEADVLFAIRQKKQDIVSRMAVGSQAYLAMGLIRDNNKQLHKNIDSARATTLTALRTAILVAQSLSNQKIILDDIDAIVREADVSVRRATRNINGEASKMRVGNVDKSQAVEQLQRAFDNVQSAIDKLSEVKAETDQQMSIALEEMETEVQDAGKRIETVIANNVQDAKTFNNEEETK